MTDQTVMDTAFYEEETDDEPQHLDPALEANQPEASEATAVPEVARFPTSISWTAPAIKVRGQYIRTRHQLKAVAPDQVAELAKPTWQKPDIFPQTPHEFAQHKFGMASDALEAKEQDIQTMKDRIAVHHKLPQENARQIMPAFGGKVFADGLSPVLALPSVWSHGYEKMHAKAAAWPTQAELLWNGDNRENNIIATRCGRYLPYPRDTMGESKQFAHQNILKPFSLDQTGPIFDNGPSPEEIQQANWVTDVEDETFENGLGRHYLGDDLMSRIGEWGPSYPLDWHIEQTITNAEMQTGGLVWQMMTDEQRATQWWNSLTPEEQDQCRVDLNNQIGEDVQQ